MITQTLLNIAQTLTYTPMNEAIKPSEQNKKGTNSSGRLEYALTLSHVQIGKLMKVLTIGVRPQVCSL